MINFAEENRRLGTQRLYKSPLRNPYIIGVISIIGLLCTLWLGISTSKLHLPYRHNCSNLSSLNATVCF